MSDLPPWWRGAGAAVGVVLLFVPHAQTLSLVYWVVFIGALIATRGSRPASTSPSLGPSVGAGEIFEKVFVGCFPYSLMLIVGAVLMVAILVGG